MENQLLLGGLRVLEYGNMISAPYCARLFADLGAEVIKLEIPGTGDFSRAYGPFQDGVPDLQASGLYLFLNTGKLGITLNLSMEKK